MATTFQPKVTRVDAGTSVQTKLKTARALQKEGKLEEAMAEFEGALKMDPYSKQAHLGAGNLKTRQKDYDSALSHFFEVLRLDPMNMSAHLRAARTYLAKGDSDKALEHAQNAVKSNPKSAVAHLAVGHIYLLKEDLANSKDALTKSLRINPRLVRARQRLSTVLRMEGKLDDALTELNAASRIEPQNPEVYESLGKLQLFRQDYGAARGAFEQVLKCNPKDDREAKLGLTESYIALHQLDPAEEVMRTITAREKGKARIHKLWGDIYQGRGLYKEAVEEYNAAKLASTDDDEEVKSLMNMDFPGEDDEEEWQMLASKQKAFAENFIATQRSTGGKPSASK